ncbi:MAG: nuclear transport factor 2 family protein [Sphingomonas sp.]|nr:nuclear transport factor 2 family protein [Sphingomonas sp.]
MTQEERFRAYIAAFNAQDWARLVTNYAPDVRLVIGNGTEMVGHDAIVSFYKKVNIQTKRTIQVRNTFTDGKRLVAELESEFVALIDAPDFTSGPLAKGDRYHINSFALYEYEGDLYTNIRAAVFRREFHRLKPA